MRHRVARLRRHARSVAAAPLALVLAPALTAQSARAELIYGYTNGGSLVSFDSANPVAILSTSTITGLANGDSVRAIDFASGSLYAVGAAGRLYTLNTATGAATQVGSGTFGAALSGSAFGFDFVAGVGHLVSNTGQRMRIDRLTGLAIDTDAITPGTQVDPALAYAAGDPAFGTTPQVTSIAYAPLPGAGGLGLFGLDISLNTIVTIGGPAQSSPAQTLGALGFDAQVRTGLDYSFASSTLYASFFLPSSMGRTSLYTINQTTGAATVVGAIGAGGGLQIDGIAVVPAPGAAGALALGAASLVARRRRA